MTKAVFTQYAAYNQWANARLYAAAAALSDADYRKSVGLFFGSLHGTLNHLVVADRIWLRRLTGEGEAPSRVDEIAHDALPDLARARVAEDARLIALVSGYNEADLDGSCAYHTTSGQAHEQRPADILQHLFNHQTHHRGQAHACLSILTGAEPPSLDLLAFQRSVPAPAMPFT